MWIKSIEIVNFQKHDHLVLEFTDKLNVLYGQSDAGKSCIIRAIKWLFFNQGKDIRKEGSKKTSVKVVLDNGIIVEKIKSNTINAYILYKDGEEKRFDAIGKTIPEEIQDALQVRTIDVDGDYINLNIADQIALPFLIGESATFRSKLFNKLTGNNITDQVFQSLNKDILQIGRETKSEEQHLAEQKEKLEEVTIQKKETETLYGNFKNEYNKLKEVYDKFNKMNKCINKMNDVNNNLEDTKTKLETIKTIPEEILTKLNKTVKELEQLVDLEKRIIDLQEKMKTTEERIASVKMPEVDIDILKENYKEFDRLKNLYARIKDNKKIELDINTKIDSCEILIKESEEKYKEVLREIKVCPFFEKECNLSKELRDEKN